MKRSPLNQASTETTVDPVRKWSTTVSNKPEMVEKNHEAEVVLCQEGWLFQKRVLKVCSHLKQENGVPASASCCLDQGKDTILCRSAHFKFNCLCSFYLHLNQLEEELRQQILENGVAGTISQQLKDKLRKVKLPASYSYKHVLIPLVTKTLICFALMERVTLNRR